MKFKFLSKDNLFEEVRDEVVYIKFKELKITNDKVKINPNLRRTIFESGLKEPIYVISKVDLEGNIERNRDFFEIIDGCHRLRCLEDIIVKKYSEIEIDEVEIPCIVFNGSPESIFFDDKGELKKREREFYKMEIDKFRGGRAVPDLEVVKFYKELDISSTILTDDISIDFTNNFDRYIHSSKLNNIKGLDKYEHKSFVAGTSQAFDSFWMRHHNKRFRCFKGEFFYHKANWKKFHKWCYLEDDRIMTNDAVVISFPFSDFCKEHPKMRKILDECERWEVPVLIDCAYYVIARDLNFDFSEYTYIEDVTFSLSKGFYNANRLRAGIRFSRKFKDDNIDIMNEWGQINHLGAYVGTKLLEKFPPDYAMNKFREKQLEYCEENDLVPTDCVQFAYGNSQKTEIGDYYKDLNRGTEVNRLCIADQIGDDV